ncbi:hypothetical protein HBH70_177940 [Parastagonospora nodorum]|nr:hypothetical protein HBH53_193630 [Parastagonospora nodorum]KAH3957782.1 hypothetical protein HBH51_219170 [Parastagonospora nodorum]KAH4002739.1 hypothetical protein HBI10_077140 [Parastagonospora nodorum]KAH4026029.1 hypothetical protein HBI13_072960 [Parastagonospora nodorum]KAH4050129.1 hypothetical protein HBH49_128520 [Parastagonospora nodorum]
MDVDRLIFNERAGINDLSMRAYHIQAYICKELPQNKARFSGRHSTLWMTMKSMAFHLSTCQPRVSYLVHGQPIGQIH